MRKWFDGVVLYMTANKTYVVYGASKGLGKAICQSLPVYGDLVFGISRTAPAYAEASLPGRTWISADLAMPHHAASAIKEAVGNAKVDCLIYNVGIWEKAGFTADYDFERTGNSEIEQMVQTNITSCLLALKSLLPNLRQSANGKIVIIGSTLGLDNHNKNEVVFSATKFAVRGIVHSLRSHLRKDRISITVLNLGDLATEDEVPPGGEKQKSNLIPLADVICALQFVLNTSNASCVKEINMPAMMDPDV